jgi:DNA-binding IclR family transcriptional regulator
MSRLLLAHLSDAEIEEYLARAAPLDQLDALFPDAGVTTAESVWADIRQMRGADHITWRSAKQFGAAYVAFPVPGVDGRLHAIVTIGGPMERFDPERAAALDEIKSTIERLRQRCLAFVPPPVVVTDRAPP